MPRKSDDGGAIIAVTGSTGELGGRVARRLERAGVRQRLIVRDASRVPEIDRAEVVVASSYGAETEMRIALQGTTTLYFVSGREEADRLDQHRALVRAAVAAGVGRIVYVSFLGAAADATFTLARDHWATEVAIREAGVAFTFLRSSLYMDVMPFLSGPGGVIRGPAGTGRFAPVSRDDLADVALAVLTAAGRFDGETLDLTGPELFDMAGIAEHLAASAGEPHRYEEESIEEAWESRRPSGAPDWQIAGWVTSYAAIADGSLEARTNEVSRVSGHPPQDLDHYLLNHPPSGSRT
jgi:NAD(P)H dehydrogenase (quinone)